MCGNAKFGRKVYRPGMVLPVTIFDGTIKQATWGFGLVHNARAETLYKTWKPISEVRNRCILEVTEFTEGLGVFKLPDSSVIKLGGIMNGDSFVLLTVDSSPQVMKFHHRMPVIVNKEPLLFATASGIDFNFGTRFKPELKLKRIIKTN